MLSVWLAMATIASASAPSSSSPASAPSDATVFQVRLSSGEHFEATLIRWRSGEGLTLLPRHALQRVVAVEDLVELRQPVVADRGEHADTARSSEQWLIGTVDGDLLGGVVTAGDETGLTLRDVAFGSMTVGLDRVTFINLRDADPASITAQGDASQDRIELRNGDRATGIVDRIDATGVSLQTGRQRLVLRWPVIQTVRMAMSNASTQDADRSPRIRWADASGSVVIANDVIWEGSVARLSRSTGGVVKADSRSMSNVRILGGRWRWLGEIPPAEYASIPFLNAKWPLAVDRNVMGGSLRVAGREAEHGIGLHSAARVRWKLDDGYERFIAGVGIDDCGGPWSDATVEVRLDDRVVARFEHLRHGQAPLPIDLDVSGTKWLELLIEFGDNGDVQDRVNLLDAALVKRR